MLCYVAVIAVLNLGLGYGLALYMEQGRKAAYAAAPMDADDL
jgi:hypothetical protein